jgi:hypothetical protein
MTNLQGDVQHAHPGPKFDYGSPLDDWKQMIMATHFRDLPDVIAGVSCDPTYPATFAAYPVQYQNTWHGSDGVLVHWPVNKRPYTGHFGSRGIWKAEVSHASLLSYDVHGGSQWEDAFQVDERGRKYRDWVQFVGLADQGDLPTVRQQLRSWLNPGIVKVGDGCEFRGIDHRQRAIVLERTDHDADCRLSFVPPEKDGGTINPVFRVRNWGPDAPLHVQMDGDDLPPHQWRAHCLQNGDLLVWLQLEITSRKQISFLERPRSTSGPSAQHQQVR